MSASAQTDKTFTCIGSDGTRFTCRIVKKSKARGAIRGVIRDESSRTARAPRPTPTPADPGRRVTGTPIGDIGDGIDRGGLDLSDMGRPDLGGRVDTGLSIDREDIPGIDGPAIPGR